MQLKKTLITLLALTGVAMADTLSLTSYNVKFGENESLTSGNALMTWGDSTTYTNWYVEFSLAGAVSNNQTTQFQWAETITTSSSTDRAGLGVLVFHKDIDGDGPGSERAWTLSFGKGGRAHVDSAVTLTFDLSDSLTFAVYDNSAYIGNKTSGKYITVDLRNVTLNGGTSMTSGEARAFSNATHTPISNVSIASLDNLAIPEGESLDIATLVTKGVAVTKPIPEPATATLSLLALAGLAVRRRR